MATEVISTIQSSGGDYTTLTAWEAGEQKDLVAADEISTAECYDFALTDDVAINGWTTDATRYIKVYAPTAERHNGTARAVSGSGFSITPSGTTATPIRIAVPHVYLEGLEIVGNATSLPTILASIGAGELYIDQCVIHDTQTGTGYTVSLSTSGVALRMRNTVVYGSCRSADLRNVTSALLENCTFWRHAAQLGVLGNSTLTTRNCYSGHAGGAAEDWWTGGTAPTGNNNASSDSSAATDYTSTVTSVASSVFVSVTAGSEDFHLQTGTNALVGAGADLSASFTVDVDGDTRPSGSAWDIGSDHRAAAGGGSTLAADAGSYAITGSAASLVATRELAAGSGSYAVTGFAAELSATRALEAGSGAYTISGSDAALVATRALAADAGAYAITGADADLTYTPASEPGAYSLAANAGAYSITGSDAGMVATRSLAADAGSYAIDGAAADLTAARALAAEPGAYVITGADADLEYSTNGLYALAAESGSYTISGSDAEFAYSGAPSGMDIEFEFEPSLWWQRKPKRIEPEKAKEKLKAVAKVIAKKAEQHVAEPEPVSQRRAEVKQAVAPLIADMPGFDWRPVYEQAYSMALTAAIGDKMREREAKETAAREIERIRQLDEEDIAILVAMM